MPRKEGILVVTCQGVYVSLPCLCTTDRTEAWPLDLEPAVYHLDPRQRNHPYNSKTRGNIGGNLSRRVRLPAMSMYT